MGVSIRRTSAVGRVTFTRRKANSCEWPSRHIIHATRFWESLPAMGLLKTDFYRFFTIGFAVGALIVVATMDNNVGSEIANNVVPAAEAQPAQ